MKTNKINILLLFIIAIFTFSCGSDELVETNIINFKLLEKSGLTSSSFEIIRVTFNPNTTEEEKQTLKEFYFFDCGNDSRPFLEICGSNFYIEMYDYDYTTRNSEFWILSTCNGSSLRFGCPENVKSQIEGDDGISIVE